ncbi:Bestrophin, RFP-TM, chloride channel-domain-containing protein [Alternaria rosae]|uniref:Bestrophin, RFP-TM, chloride channel-domain-containing protein n=1 Tax=Alternaria rosae TaxID=1187941 RepID=UPI001E8D4121|nr:Bestrophin, RFP-TM, chloride channel-domain-containing protein [Alternaria rosae]KAH6872792.1 Bestrophin, RFP-TM, chloride channel-domain-containing protein [Alternaria rosae]
MQSTANVSNDTNGASTRPPLKKQESDKDFDDYFASIPLSRLLLLTVLGFVVGLALSFRSSTAYERYNDGRKYWAQLTFASQNLARLIWIHVDERHEKDTALGKQDLLAKINCLNLITAYAVALKHKLRFEPHMHYDDLKHLVGHLDTFARDADQPDMHKKPSIFKTAGQFLGLPMAESNPRKLLKRSRAPLGNLPLEILNHLSVYMKSIYDNGTFKVSIYQTQSLNALTTFNDVLAGTERILSTPLPLAYSIAISQITWVYILLLPFQLYKLLGYITIPASVFAAYIILGIALIGREIENPFGNDVNDLPLDAFCLQIRKDIDIIMSKPASSIEEVVMHPDNQLLYPLSTLGGAGWAAKSVDEIRDALATKPGLHFPLVDHHEHPKPGHSVSTGARRRMTSEDRAEMGEAGHGRHNSSAGDGGD